MIEVKLTRRADNWKDRMAGWSQYTIHYVCYECHAPITETLYGTRESIAAYAAEPDNHICEYCRRMVGVE